MKLTLKDRVLILNSILPQFDTMANMKLKIHISEKVKITPDEQSNIVMKDAGQGQIEIGFKTIDAQSKEREFEMSNEELIYLKSRVEFIDRNGMISAETIDSYSKIMDEPLEQEANIVEENYPEIQE